MTKRILIPVALLIVATPAHADTFNYRCKGAVDGKTYSLRLETFDVGDAATIVLSSPEIGKMRFAGLRVPRNSDCAKWCVRGKQGAFIVEFDTATRGYGELNLRHPETRTVATYQCQNQAVKP